MPPPAVIITICCQPAKQQTVKWYNPGVVGGPFLLWYGVVVALAAAGLAFFITLEPPRSWWMLAVTLAMVASGTHYLALAHPGYRYYERRPPTFPYWVAPLALALGGALFSEQFLRGWFTLIGMSGTAAGVAVLIYCQHLLAHPDAAAPAFARIITSLSVYLAAFLLFVSLQSSDLPAAARMAVLGAVSGILSLAILEERSSRLDRAFLYAGVVSLLIIELSWALLLLPLGRVATGLLLLMAFYFISGLAHSHLLNRLNRGVALEFVSVTLIALGVLYWFQVAAG